MLKLITVKTLITILISFTFAVQTNAQLRIAIGGTFGGGYIKGNSPFIGSFSSSLFLETNTPLFSTVYPRLSFIVAKDFNSIIPNVSKPYYPYVRGITFKGVTTHYFDSRIFIEEGVGLLVLNDRTFSDTNLWDYGAALSINVGYDLRGYNLYGFKLGAGAEYGLTFLNTLPQYSSIHIFIQYTY